MNMTIDNARLAGDEQLSVRYTLIVLRERSCRRLCTTQYWQI